MALVVLSAAACRDEATAPPTASPNRRPTPTSTIPPQELAAGDTLTLDASAYFTDPDGDALTFSVETSDRGVASASLSGATVAVVGVAPGEARVTIRARDPRALQARLDFTVLVPVPVTADHVVLRALYEATGGEGWTHDDNWLTGRPLDTWYGVGVDAEGRVTDLRLDFNGLRGPLPPELGDLDRLQSLVLSRNELTGAVPPELGRLPILVHLDLRNNRFAGEIPPLIGDFGYLDVLDLAGNEFEGPIPVALGKLGALRWLDLSDNHLTGPVPSELGGLGRIETLLLMRNDLEGPVPAAFGRLAALRVLNLSGNAGLSGPVPVEWTSMRRLSQLHLGGSTLCAPAAPAFRDWLERLYRYRLAACGQDASIVLTQAVQSSRFPVPLVAGDSALLRVFLTTPEGASVDFPAVRARFYLDGAETHVVDIPAQSNPVPTVIEEGDLAASANAVIPGRVVQPGLEIVVETDPGATLNPALGLTRRIPDNGRRAVDVRRMPTFNLTVIPFVLASEPDNSIVGYVNDLTPEHELFWDTHTLLPVGAMTVRAHEAVMVSTNSQGALLSRTAMIRAAEGSIGHYMGTMTNSDGGGLAYVGGFASFSSHDRADIVAHEFGHNMSLSHAPCSATGPDPWYPGGTGHIGAWGYDFRDGGELVPPERPDIMGYCDPHWIGDYHFYNAMRFRLRTEPTASASRAAGGGNDRSLLLWGGVSEAGVPYLEPAFVLDAPPSLPRPGGDHRIRGRNASGEELFALRFDMWHIDHGNGALGFAFAVPVQPEWSRALASLTLSGPEGSFTLDGESDLPTAIVRNPATRQVRAILQDPSAAGLAGAVAEALAPDPALEAMVSRGLPDPADWDR
ncbi:MAG: M66 family metalloprotease [Gemmatimonadota bacterium]|uniref:M66 family metalloprotease n=1 Tax=Candidatus Palauibacter scopulicola TaxID=3056741 RepID=UPI002397EE88|nr:M66 family metalloprotease [Candidatus Palauibacter scopulicola]MDE2661640.1 M66 family metalloprotease [Candidatus Palauibacter scopulicola]